MKIVVIIPTYNEKDNIEQMIIALAGERKLIKNHDLQALFVDDTSPDKTYEVIKKFQKQYPWVHLLLNKQKVGLGGAYSAGIKHAVHKLKANAFIESDVDGQHDPRDIKRLIAELDKGYDYIIGSRYIKGGSIPKEWGFNRKFLSVVGNLVARTLLLLPNIHDVTTGFKLTRVAGFTDKLSLEPASKEKITLSEIIKSKTAKSKKLLTNSFAYKVQLLFEMVQANAKVKEIPIHFLQREKGKSKLINNELFETLRVIFILQILDPKIRQFIKFGIVGFVGYIVQATTLQIFSLMKFPEPVIWGGSAEFAIISNFTWNNLWTFKANKITGSKKILIKFLHFNLTSIGAVLIQMIAGTVFVSLFGPQYRQLYLPLIVVFMIIPYNYLIYTKIIWKKPN